MTDACPPAANRHGDGDHSDPGDEHAYNGAAAAAACLSLSLSEGFDFEYLHPIDWQSNPPSPVFPRGDDAAVNGDPSSAPTDHVLCSTASNLAASSTAPGRDGADDGDDDSDEAATAAAFSAHADQLLRPTVPPPPVVTLETEAAGPDYSPGDFVANGDAKPGACDEKTNNQAAPQAPADVSSCMREASPGGTWRPAFDLLVGEPALFFTLPRQRGNSATPVGPGALAGRVPSLVKAAFGLAPAADGTAAATTTARSDPLTRRADTLAGGVGLILSALHRRCTASTVGATVAAALCVLLPLAAMLCSTRRGGDPGPAAVRGGLDAATSVAALVGGGDLAHMQSAVVSTFIASEAMTHNRKVVSELSAPDDGKVLSQCGPVRGPAEMAEPYREKPCCGGGAGVKTCGAKASELCLGPRPAGATAMPPPARSSHPPPSTPQSHCCHCTAPAQSLSPSRRRDPRLRLPAGKPGRLQRSLAQVPAASGDGEEVSGEMAVVDEDAKVVDEGAGVMDAWLGIGGSTAAATAVAARLLTSVESAAGTAAGALVDGGAQASAAATKAWQAVTVVAQQSVDATVAVVRSAAEGVADAGRATLAWANAAAATLGELLSSAGAKAAAAAAATEAEAEAARARMAANARRLAATLRRVLGDAESEARSRGAEAARVLRHGWDRVAAAMPAWARVV
ncbi:hypothetical protein HK405_008523 [Cladochytrium tenue]|nr:hypothetical protein HK405_008523 [Cladochytrium tenue]